MAGNLLKTGLGGSLVLMKSLFSESGDVSMMRAMMFFVIVDIMFVWTALCIKGGSFVDIPPDMLVLIGTMVAGKVAQKYGEKKPGAVISNGKTEG